MLSTVILDNSCVVGECNCTWVVSGILAHSVHIGINCTLAYACTNVVI